MAKLIKGALDLAEKAIGALDMSHQARMARARELGFDTDRVWYHGRSNKGEDFSRETERRPFLTTSRERAQGYGAGDPEAFYLRMDNPARANEYSDMFHNAAYSQDGRQWLAEHGHDAVLDAGNPWDSGPRPAGDVVAPFDVAQIRSVTAAFDPAKKDSSNLLASAVGAALLGGGALQSEDAEASFIGQAAKTFSQQALEVARRMEQAGASRDDIWRETGALGHPTYKDVDGHWKQEIEDDLTMDAGRFSWGQNGDLYEGLSTGANLGDYASSPNLEAAYDGFFDFGDMDTRLQSFIRANGSGGSFNPESGLITHGIAKQPTEFSHKYQFDEDNRETLAHELQHAIQFREGFATGGSPEQFTQQEEAKIARDAISWAGEVRRMREEMPGADVSAVENAVVEQYRQQDAMDWLPSEEARNLGTQPYMLYPEHDASGARKKVEELVSLYGLDRNVTPADSTELYRRLAGEAEARNVQSRLNMGMEERINTPPWQTLDVPEDKLIVHGSKLPAALATAGILGSTAASADESLAASINGALSGQPAQLPAPSIESQIANNYGALHAADPLPPLRELPASLANAALETMAGVNRGVTEAVDFATVDQLNAILELMGVDWRAPNLTGALSPATQGNFLKPGTHRDSARALGELLSPSPI